MKKTKATETSTKAVRLDFIVKGSQGGQRLDALLQSAAQDEGIEWSRRKTRQLIEQGAVYLNRKRLRYAAHIVQIADHIQVEYYPANQKAIDSGLKILPESAVLFQAKDIIAINKPPGMPSQATRDQAMVHAETALQALLEAKGQKKTLILVHRLDKETTGVLLFATNSNRATELTDLFREREVKKTYLAVCLGIPMRQEFKVDAPLSDIDKKTGDVRIVTSGGRSALTEFVLLSQNARLGISLIECHPATGRSHQIRVHLASQGLPIVGDKRYGKRNLPSSWPEELRSLASAHHFLHAQRIAFSIAGGNVEVEAPLPERLEAFLKLTGMALLHK